MQQMAKLVLQAGLSRTSPCCATRRSCSDRSHRARPRGGCCPIWTVRSSASYGQLGRRHGSWLGRGEPSPRQPAAGHRGRLPVPGLVLGLDASIVVCHTEKSPRHRPGRRTSATTRCSASWTTPARRRPGCCEKAGPGTTAGHIAVLDDALAQVPDAHRGTAPRPWSGPARPAAPTGSSPTSAGCGRTAWTRFPVGVAITEPIRQAILRAKQHSQRVPTLDTDGGPRDGAQACELTGLVSDEPHPGARLSLLDTTEGMRHQVMATGTPPDQPGCASPNTGPGQPTTSPRPAGSPRYPDQSREPDTPPRRAPPENPGHTPGHHHAQNPDRHPTKINWTLASLGRHLAKIRS